MQAENKLELLSEEIGNDFDYLGDCIWKLNEQLDVIKETELAKLELYHANDPRGSELRWMLESPKHETFFPTALNYAFIVLVFITLETRMMRLCDVLYEERNFAVRAEDTSGSGLER